MQCHLHLHIVQATNNSKIEIEQECNAEQAKHYFYIEFIPSQKTLNHNMKTSHQTWVRLQRHLLWLMTSLYTCDSFFYF